MKKRKKFKSHLSNNKPEVRAWVQPFANQQERQEFLMNVAISREFEMRYRGLVEYYGKELIAYKRERPLDKQRNEFLRVLSKFMTDCLEDNCPPSWKECNYSFWEEFIFTFCPLHMKISPEEKEVETFLSQLKEFVQWLDQRVGTTWYSIIETFSTEAAPELKVCEHLLNDIFLNDYPRIYEDDWNPMDDINRLDKDFAECKERRNSLFEVTNIIGDTVVLSEFNFNYTYKIKGLPLRSIKPGLIMSGVIGKKKGDLFWTWFETVGIFPQRGKSYIKLIS
jgi:hypothetical protein